MIRRSLVNTRRAPTLQKYSVAEKIIVRMNRRYLYLFINLDWFPADLSYCSNPRLELAGTETTNFPANKRSVKVLRCAQ